QVRELARILDGHVLRATQQYRAIALPTTCFINPQQVNIQRIPEDLGGESCDHGSAMVPDREHNMTCAQGPGLCFVETSEARVQFGCDGSQIVVFGGDGVQGVQSLRARNSLLWGVPSM